MIRNAIEILCKIFDKFFKFLSLPIVRKMNIFAFAAIYSLLPGLLVSEYDFPLWSIMILGIFVASICATLIVGIDREVKAINTVVACYLLMRHKNFNSPLDNP